MKILCLIDNPIKPGDRWLWKYLPSNNDEVHFLVATGAVDRFQKWGKLLNYCPAFFLSGLMSKPMIVTLPFVFLLLDYWPLGRIAEARAAW